MATAVEQRVTAVEERTDTLEALLGQFIVTTNAALIRMERGIAELKEEMRVFRDESERDRKRMDKKWGELANKMGTVVEDIAAPNVPRIARVYFSMEDLDFFGIRIKKRNSKDRALRREFDVIAVSDDSILLNETKSTATIDYINEFIMALREIDDYFPQYKGRRLIPIFSSLAIPENIQSYLTKNKIYAMAMKDDTMDLLNFDALQSDAAES